MCYNSVLNTFIYNYSNADLIRTLEFSQWLEVLGQLFQTMLKLLRAVQVIIVNPVITESYVDETSS